MSKDRADFNPTLFVSGNELSDTRSGLTRNKDSDQQVNSSTRVQEEQLHEPNGQVLKS